MLAENLVDMPFSQKTVRMVESADEHHHDANGEMNGRCRLGGTEQPGSGRELFCLYHNLVLTCLKI